MTDLHCFPNNLLAIAFNLSPFIQNLHHVAIQRMINMLKLLSTEHALNTNPNNIELITKILACFENMLVSQYASNVSLVLGCWRH